MGQFIRPWQQFRFAFAMLSTGILTIALLMGYLVSRFSQLADGFQAYDPVGADFLRSNLNLITNTLIICQAVLWLFSVFIGILVFHRIYGPVVPIVRHVKNLAQGDYASRVKLRKGDALEEIATALNELAEQLAKK